MNERDRRAPLPPRVSPDATPRAGVAALAPRPPAAPPPVSPDATPRAGIAAIAPRPAVAAPPPVSPDATPRGGLAAIAPRAPAVPPALPTIDIPHVTWSTAPPPAPPRTFSTEPPPLASPSMSPPVKTLARRQDDDEPTAINPTRLAEEVANEARAAVRIALDEALAPMHYRMRDLLRRLEEIELKVAAAAAAPPAPAPAPGPAPPAVQAVAVGDPFAPAAAVHVAAAPQVPVMPVVPALPPLPRFDDYAIPFDGQRRKRRLLLLAGALFVLVFGGLLALMLASRISATG